MTPAELVEFVGRVGGMRAALCPEDCCDGKRAALDAFESVVGMLADTCEHSQRCECYTCDFLTACRRAGIGGGEMTLRRYDIVEGWGATGECENGLFVLASEAEAEIAALTEQRDAALARVAELVTICQKSQDRMVVAEARVAELEDKYTTLDADNASLQLALDRLEPRVPVVPDCPNPTVCGMVHLHEPQPLPAPVRTDLIQALAALRAWEKGEDRG